jgi:aminobenzoyl-glutamate utilization protein B
MRSLILLTLLLFTAIPKISIYGQPVSENRLQELIEEVTGEVRNRAKLTQVIVDKIFSFGELGFQEYETSAYLVDLLKRNGFEVEEGIAGIPTAWMARWGSGRPVIALGSDIDGIPKSNQKPGVAYHTPLIEGAPGHGEGHNSGQAVNVTAALALKMIMEREAIEGTLVMWPGVAEELVATKAYFVRDGYFEGIDVTLFTHVDSNMEVEWGQPDGTGLVSVEFTFTGEAAHGAGDPWRGRSALDAVELMNTGWNYRREHLRPKQRSHYVIKDGGDQPNVVPQTATVWYFFREMTYPLIKQNFERGINTARGAALMTDTEMHYRILGEAWPRHFNKVVAETTNKHIQAVGLPDWSEDDQSLAKAVQRLLGEEERGLDTELDEFGPPPEEPDRGGSDDIGNISWVVPTVTLRFPANIPGRTGHHWSSAIAMATPIAHKGANSGAQVLARTALELMLRPELVDSAWTYLREVQTKDIQYTPFISAEDRPAIELNADIMERHRESMREFYFNEEEYDTYLEQLGIDYPALSKPKN